jgi:hypothetical protein
MISDRYARNRKLRILQIFNRYEFVGGEEIIVERIGKALALFHTVGKFGSTAEIEPILQAAVAGT